MVEEQPAGLSSSAPLPRAVMALPFAKIVLDGEPWHTALQRAPLGRLARC